MQTIKTEETDEALILILINNRIEATRNKDINSALSCYAPDVLSFDVVDPLEYRGSEAIRTRLENWFSSFQGAIGLEISDLKISSGTDVAFCYGLCHVQATTKDGNKLDMWWRETTCLRKIYSARDKK